MYKVYIAAASTPDQIERVISWGDLLTKSGLSVVSTWPSVVVQVGQQNPRDATTTDRLRWSVNDLNEVAKADALWLMCPPNGTVTRGAWVELGFAYDRGLLLVSSGDTKQSIYSALGAEIESDEAAFQHLLVAAAKKAERDQLR